MLKGECERFMQCMSAGVATNKLHFQDSKNLPQRALTALLTYVYT